MCSGRGSNQGPLGPKSDALTTAPLRHLKQLYEGSSYNSDRNGYFDRESNINDDQAMNIRRYGDEDSAQYSIS